MSNNVRVESIAWPIILLGAIGFAAMNGFYTTDEGERNVVLRNGSLVKIAEPGLGIKIPFIDEAHAVSVRDNTVGIKLESYSYDQQPANLIVSVTFRIQPSNVGRLYSEYGNIPSLITRVVERRTPDAVKNVFGKFTAVRAIQEREKLSMDIREAVTKEMKDAPLEVVSVQLEEVGFSQTYEQSIEQRMLAQVQIETTRQQKQTAEVNAEIAVVKATAEANAQREKYKAEADGIVMRGEAEAKAIELRAKALAANPHVVALTTAEKWDGKLPTTQVPGSSVPFINVGNTKE